MFSIFFVMKTNQYICCNVIYINICVCEYTYICVCITYTYIHKLYGGAPIKYLQNGKMSSEDLFFYFICYAFFKQRTKINSLIFITIFNVNTWAQHLGILFWFNNLRYGPSTFAILESPQLIFMHSTLTFWAPTIW